MEQDTGQAGIHAVIIAIVILIIGWFFLFPEVCRVFPLQVPGGGFDYCWIFR